MKTFLIAAAAAASLAGAALPAAAQSWDYGYRPAQVRPVEQRFDRGYGWRSWQAREIERRIADRRRIEWELRHRYAYRDGGYGYDFRR